LSIGGGENGHKSRAMTVLGLPTLALISVAMTVAGLAGCQSGSSDLGTSGHDSTASAAAAAAARVSGQFDVGGRELSLNCDGVGSPTIVFESGLGVPQGGWIDIRRSIRSVRTCAYDRVNVGRSDQVAVRHTGRDSVRDLHTLLNMAGVAGPYILVGASFGGLLSIMYAGTYPTDVVGLVLLDPTPPTWDKVFVDLVPEPERAAEIANLRNNPEHVDFLETLEQAKAMVAKVPNVPVLLLAATRSMDGTPATWPAEQMAAVLRREHQRLVDAVAQGELRMVESGHQLQREVPQIVMADVQRVLDATR
jgi:pimeloyl-ACP methyl ester carboxylesterase